MNANLDTIENIVRKRTPLWEAALPSPPEETPSAARHASQRGQSGERLDLTTALQALQQVKRQNQGKRGAIHFTSDGGPLFGQTAKEFLEQRFARFILTTEKDFNMTEEEYNQRVAREIAKGVGNPLWDLVKGRLDGRGLREYDSAGYGKLRSLYGPKMFRSRANGGVGLDELADEAVRSGLLPQGSRGDDLLQALYDKPRILNQSAFHGTPHRFDRFSLEYINTGEGAQAFGWGLYFAGHKSVAEYYRETLSSRNIVSTIKIIGEYNIVDERSWRVIEIFDNGSERLYDHYLSDDELVDFFGDTAKKILERADAGENVEGEYDVEEIDGQLYEVEIPDDDVLLDYDKPLSEQPEKVRELLPGIKKLLPKNALEDLGGDWNLLFSPENIGMEFYNTLSSLVGSDEAVSRLLNEAGIPGLRYLDGGSRRKGEGSHNYVIWDDALVQIEKTYYQYAGQQSRMSDPLRANLAEAMSLAESGTDNEAIRRKTGWFRGMDEKWRYEIPDNLKGINFSPLSQRLGAIIPLPEIYDNPALYEAYPFLREISVRDMHGDEYGYGFFDPTEGKGVIVVDREIYTEPLTTPNPSLTLVHEVQHAIQDIEGFARGGSPDFASIHPERNARRIELNKILTSMAKSGKYGTDEYIKLRDEVNSILNENWEFDKPGSTLALEKYNLLAGEIEAQDTANRSGMSDSERTAKAPNLREDAIVIFGGEKVAAMSIDPEKADDALRRDAEAFAVEVDKVKEAGKAPSSAVPMLKQTPLVLRLIGRDVKTGKRAAEGGLYVSPHTFENALAGVHGVTLDMLKQIPEALADPIAIFDSATKRNDGDVVFMLELKDKDGKTIVVPVALQSVGGSRGRREINIVKSAYGKGDNKPAVQWFLDQAKKNARYMNGQKMSGWAQAARVQFPIGATSNQNKNTIYTEADLVNLRNQNPGLYSGNPSSPRGAIRFASDGRALVGLFKGKKDLSTVLHEASHFFLNNLAEAAQLPDAPQWVKDDFETLRKKYGFTGFDIPTEAHEAFARAGEVYFRTGEAPAESLREAFRQFRNWLTAIYRSVKRFLGMHELDPEVRDIFDRLLATEEEIARARSSLPILPLGEDPEVSPEARTKYEKAVAEARADTTRRIEKKRLQEQRKAEKDIRPIIREKIAEEPFYALTCRFDPLPVHVRTGQGSVYQRMRQASIGVYCVKNGNTLPLDHGKRQAMRPPAGQRGGPGI
jgi:hypothetical protein